MTFDTSPRLAFKSGALRGAGASPLQPHQIGTKHKAPIGGGRSTPPMVCLVFVPFLSAKIVEFCSFPLLFDCMHAIKKASVGRLYFFVCIRKSLVITRSKKSPPSSMNTCFFSDRAFFFFYARGKHIVEFVLRHKVIYSRAVDYLPCPKIKKGAQNEPLFLYYLS